MKKAFITILMICLTYNIYSCDCLKYPIESDINKVDIIFTGKVIEILDKNDTSHFINNPVNKEFFKDKGYRVKVLILKRLKTGKLISDTLEFTSDFTNCDPLYKLGESYLFFANKCEGGKFKMAHCTWWGTVDKSKGNIKKIKVAIRKVKKEKIPTKDNLSKTK